MSRLLMCLGGGTNIAVVMARSPTTKLWEMKMNEMTGNGMAGDEVKSDSNARERLQSIITLQMEGRVQEAHDAYVNYFEQNEIDYPALNMFGICCMALGRYDKARGLFQHIVENAPIIEEASLYLAECCIELADYDDALLILQAFSEANNNDYRPHLLVARACISKNQQATALECLHKAYGLGLDSNDILLLVAPLFLACQDAKAALKAYNRVLFNDPQNVEALLGQSELLADSGSWDCVLTNCNNVINRHPYHQRARRLHCMALFELKKFEEALDSAKIMACAAPESPQALEVLSQAYLETGDNHAALMVGKQLLSHEPESLIGLQIVAGAYYKLGQYDQSLSVNQEILKNRPNNLVAIENVAVNLERLCRLDEAISAYDRVLEELPNRETAKFNKSISLLLKGELRDGFRLYETRLDPAQKMVPSYIGDEPIWDGISNIEGKHLLIHPEQGFGDTIMCCRFIQFLEDRGARLTFAVQPALASVMKTLESPAKLITVGEDLKGIDLHVPLMSLAHITYDQWVNAPALDSYLQVPSEARHKWTKELGFSSNMRVGFVCSGNPKHLSDAVRSLNMATFLDALPNGPEYHLLQKDLRETDIAAIKGRKNIIRYDRDIVDFADTAALCSLMDIVVSVDTSVAHLAGAIGSRTMLMLPWWPDWRWGLDVETNIWYQNLTSIRQAQHRDWSHALQRLRKEIHNEIIKAS